jgi:hypothetical protein
MLGKKPSASGKFGEAEMLDRHWSQMNKLPKSPISGFELLFIVN